MAWLTTKTDWVKNDTVGIDDYNRIENDTEILRNHIDVSGRIDWWVSSSLGFILPITLTAGQTLRLISVKYDFNFDPDDYPNPKPVYPDAVLDDRVTLYYADSSVWESASYTGAETPDTVLYSAGSFEVTDNLVIEPLDLFTNYVMYFNARLEVY